MKTFTCNSCGKQVFFENTRCVNCQATLGYLPDQKEMAAIEQIDQSSWRASPPDGNQLEYRKCRNYEQANICNWMIPQSEQECFCVSCRLNSTIPDLSLQENVARWSRIEAAKRRLVYSLLDLGLPVKNKDNDPQYGLSFDLLADTSTPTGQYTGVTTGHENGTITLNIAEADDLHREQARLQMNENYRTLLGHFRHEIGHYYWLLLVSGSPLLDEYRNRFGDERENYNQALENYYKAGPPKSWHERFVSAYASAHPWEDWAETWAHYLHMRDTLQTADAFGMKVRSFPHQEYSLPDTIDASKPVDNEFVSLITEWLPLTIALNSINRSMGHKDMYPFILSSKVIAKLQFVHHVVSRQQ